MLGATPEALFLLLLRGRQVRDVGLDPGVNATLFSLARCVTLDGEGLRTAPRQGCLIDAHGLVRVPYIRGGGSARANAQVYAVSGVEPALVLVALGFHSLLHEREFGSIIE